jgi:hypothetical protein
MGGAIGVNALVARDGMFDIRAQGVVHTVLFLFAAIMFAGWARKFSLGRRLLLYGLVLFIFADVGYIAYFNSFYSEPALFIFGVTMIAISLRIIDGGDTIRRPWLWTVVFYVAAGLFVFAKVQTAILGLPVAYLGWRLFRQLSPKLAPKPRMMPAIGIVLAVMFAAISVSYYAVSAKFSDDMRYQNMYKAVFYEILGHSEDVYADAQALGVDPGLVNLAGTTPHQLGNNPQVKSYLLTQMGYGKVLKFYLRHPGRVVDQVKRCSAYGFTLRPTHLGNWTIEYAEANRIDWMERILLVIPNEYKSFKYALWSSLKGAVFPKSGLVLVVFVLVNAAAITIKRIRFDKTPKAQMLTDLHAVVVIMALLQFFTSTMGEGEYDIVKHLFAFNMLAEVAFVFVVAYVYTILLGLRKKPAAQVETIA